MAIHKLYQTKLKDLPDGMHSDGDGLYLRVRGNSRSWILRFRKDGRLRDIGLGSLRYVPLASARKKARLVREQMAMGDLPWKKTAPEVRTSFGDLAPKAIDNYINVKRLSASRQKSLWRSVRMYAMPVLRDKDVTEITKKDVLAVLSPIWEAKHPTARITLAAMGVVLGYAKSLGIISGELATAWKDNLEAFLPSSGRVHRTVHHTPIPLAEVPGIVERMRGMGSRASQAILLGFCTVLRSAEFISVKWEYIDFGNAVLTVPRTKGKDRPFRVPLSTQAVALLKSLPRNGEWAVHLKGNSSVRDPWNGTPYTSHSIRSSFSMWCAEHGVDRDLREMCLAHEVDNKVAASYQQSDLLERRREVMQAWCDYCFSTPSSSASGRSA